MARRGGSVGIAILIVTMAIVLILVSRAWHRLAPTAIDVGHARPVAVEDHGETEASDAVNAGDLPDLDEMRQETDKHAQQVGDALSEIE